MDDEANKRIAAAAAEGERDRAKRMIVDVPGDQRCDHGVYFDEEAARGFSAHVVRKRWPRLEGRCPKGCGFVGIGYASFMHYIMGDW